MTTMMMTRDQLRAIYDRYNDAINQRDLALADCVTDEISAPDMIIHWGNGEERHLKPGPEGQKVFSRILLEGNPDYHGTIEDFLVDGDKTAIRMTMILNNPTTRQPETFSVIYIDRWLDGKVAESWRMGDWGKW